MESTLGSRPIVQPAKPIKDGMPPGPPPSKNLFETLQQIRTFTADGLKYIQSMFDDYGDTYYVHFGNAGQINIRHPDDLHRVLVTDSAKYYKDASYKNREVGLARFMGNGLIVSDGDFWKRQRRLAAPAFHSKRITSYAGTMVEFTEMMLRDWRDGLRLDVSRQMRNLTMRIVAKTLFNTAVSG